MVSGVERRLAAHSDGLHADRNVRRSVDGKVNEYNRDDAGAESDDRKRPA